MKRRSPSGLTFIELLMAVTITACLLTGLSAHLRGGMLAWRRTMTALDAMTATRALLERCARDLAQAARCDPPAAAPPLSFRYGYLADDNRPQIIWQSTWNDATRLPRLVEITVDDASARVRRVVVIPPGVLPPAGGG